MIQQWRPEQSFTLLKPRTAEHRRCSYVFAEFARIQAALMSSRIALTSSRIGQHGKDSPGDVMLSESTADGTPGV
jgi:hypothetical protein